MLRNLLSRLVDFGLASTAIATVSSRVTKVTGTRCGCPEASAVASRATRLFANRYRACSCTHRIRTHAHTSPRAPRDSPSTSPSIELRPLDRRQRQHREHVDGVAGALVPEKVFRSHRRSTKGGGR